MIEGMVFWMLVAVFQVSGVTGEGFGTEQACQERRDEVLLDKDALAVSECKKIEVNALKRG